MTKSEDLQTPAERRIIEQMKSSRPGPLIPYDPTPRPDVSMPPSAEEARLRRRIEELEAELATALRREATTTARYDQRIEKLEAERSAAYKARFKAGLEDEGQAADALDKSK